MRPGPKLAGRLAVQPDRGAGRLEAWHALRQQACDHARQHVAGAGRGERRRGVIGDAGAPVGGGDHRIGALEQHDCTTQTSG